MPSSIMTRAIIRGLPISLLILALTPCLGAESDPIHGPIAGPVADPGAVAPPASTASAPAPDPASTVNGVPSYLPPLPALPPGKSTVIGGVIRAVDPVRDEMTLGVYGGRSVKILFDERTRFYRDGVRTPLDDLRVNQHASVETALDGDSIFAISVHMLSRAPQGECQGQVLAFDPRDGEVTVRNLLSDEPIRIRVEPRTTIARMGQPAFAAAVTGTSDLMRGALISVQFESQDGEGVADAISILATPGSGFYFSGNLTYLDLGTGRMGITDPRDQSSYAITFDPALFPASRRLHPGDRVGVTARFDGEQYVATRLDVF